MLQSIEVEQIGHRLADDDPEVRRIAVMDLLDIGEEDVMVPLLVRAARDADASVRTEAARCLEGMESESAIGGLLDLLVDDELEVREAAATSLAEIKEASHGSQLLDRLSTADGFAKASILRALRELRRTEAYGPALQALNDHNPAVRAAAVGVLGYLKNAKALPDIARLAKTDPDPEVRRITVGALAFAQHVPEVGAALVDALKDTSWQVREEAATTLGKLGDRAAIHPLVEAMDDPYWQVRLKATRSLGKLKAAEAMEVLTQTLSHAVSNLRKEVAIALGEIGNLAAVPYLEEALNDPDPDVRKMCRLALSQLGALKS